MNRAGRWPPGTRVVGRARRAFVPSRQAPDRPRAPTHVLAGPRDGCPACAGPGLQRPLCTKWRHRPATLALLSTASHLVKRARRELLASTGVRGRSRLRARFPAFGRGWPRSARGGTGDHVIARAGTGPPPHPIRGVARRLDGVPPSCLADGRGCNCWSSTSRPPWAQAGPADQPPVRARSARSGQQAQAAFVSGGKGALAGTPSGSRQRMRRSFLFRSPASAWSAARRVLVRAGHTGRRCQSLPVQRGFRRTSARCRPWP